MNLIITPFKIHVIISTTTAPPPEAPLHSVSVIPTPESNFVLSSVTIDSFCLFLNFIEVALYRMYFCACLDSLVCYLVHTFINIKRYPRSCLEGKFFFYCHAVFHCMNVCVCGIVFSFSLCPLGSPTPFLSVDRWALGWCERSLAQQRTRGPVKHGLQLIEVLATLLAKFYCIQSL